MSNYQFIYQIKLTNIKHHNNYTNLKLGFTTGNIYIIWMNKNRYSLTK